MKRRRRMTAWLHLPATTRTFKKGGRTSTLGGGEGGGGGAARQVVFSRSADRLMGSSRRSSPARCVRALPPLYPCASVSASGRKVRAAVYSLYLFIFCACVLAAPSAIRGTADFLCCCYFSFPPLMCLFFFLETALAWCPHSRWCCAHRNWSWK